jgi:hypothetical protein
MKVSRDPASARLAGARPVADAPVNALIARADELARRWACAMIAARPLAEMAEVPLEDLAREAPAICTQLARALSSDGELEQLLAPATAGEPGRARPDGPGAPAAWLAPARDAGSAVRDIEVLRGVLWEAALGELRQPTAGQVADLSDRLAYVCAALVAVLLDRHDPASGAPTASAPPAPGRERVLYSSPRTSPGGRRAVLIDERVEPVRSPAGGREAPAPPTAAPLHAAARSPRQSEREEGSRQEATTARPRPWDTPLDAGSRAAAVLQDPAPRGAVPDGAGAELRVTRGAGARVDERA